jgi:hypothetical protein
LAGVYADSARIVKMIGDKRGLKPATTFRPKVDPKCSRGL